MTKRTTLKQYQPGRGFTKEDWDAVDSPEATDEQIAQARPFAEAFPELAESIRRNLGGRPKAENPKQPVSIRLDRDVIDGFKASGDGWQSRVNDALRKHLGI